MMLLYEELSREILGAAIEVHRELGPGLLESAYEECLCRELELREIRFQRQLELPVIDKGTRLDCGYRIDVLVEDQVLLEIKAAEALAPIHKAQLMTYLRLSQKRVGLLMNFHVVVMKDGIQRIIL
jgi:GxxExxY protein